MFLPVRGRPSLNDKHHLNIRKQGQFRRADLTKTQLSAFVEHCPLSPFWISGIIYYLLKGRVWNLLYSWTWRNAMLTGRVGVRYVP